MQISFVIPCLNESNTIVDVIKDCHFVGKQFESYEIIVSDNRSLDESAKLALANNAKVVHSKIKGYGSSLKEGIKHAKGKYIVIGDADLTYDFKQTIEFIKFLDKGFDMVIGNRFKGKIQKNAMPASHYYLGNPILSALGRSFFGISIGDFHCGLRALTRKSIIKLDLESNGMEFASEMLIKASLVGLKIGELPTNLRKSSNDRESHLRTWRDGWRHLKYMLSFAPNFNLLPSAIFLFVIGIVLISFYIKKFSIFWGTNTLLLSISLFILSFNIASDYILSREIIYNKYRINKFSKFSRISKITGLNKGTDRLFKLSFISFILSILFGVKFFINYLGDNLSSQGGIFNGFIFSITMVFSISCYLTATKLTTFRLLYKNKKFDSKS